MSDDGAASTGPRRRKASGPRSKIGCITCRIRRVKCDECKPDCHRCASTGRRCDWERAPSPPELARQNFDPFQAPPVFLIPIVSRDYEERRSFAFFHTQTAPQLSGCFGSKFWDQLILQSTHQCQILWHAAVALGSIHERFSLADPSIYAPNADREHGGFALKQYSKAISSLANPVGACKKQSADVILAACMLFACFELMRGHHGAALGHAESGIKILAEIQNDNASQWSADADGIMVPAIPLVSIDTLTVLFTRLDTQVCELLPDRLGRILKTSQDEFGFGPVIPSKFSSVLEARNCFDYLYNNAIHKSPMDRGPSIRGRDEIQDYDSLEALHNFALFGNALGAFLQDPGTRLESKGRQAVNMLKLQLILMMQTFSALGVPGEMVWDKFSLEYEDMIELAEAILQQDRSFHARRAGSQSSRTLSMDAGVSISQEGGSSPDDEISLGSSNEASFPMRTFSMDAGIIAPLYNTVWKCRISRIRQKGIALLKSYPRQEGVWDGVLVGLVCERIVAIEEEDFGNQITNPADLPEYARILQVAVKFDKENRRALLEYSKMKSKYNAEIVKIVDTLYW